MAIDLDSMDIKELRDLKNKLDRAIGSYEDRKRRQALAAVEEAAREYGFNLTELTALKTRGSTAVPKYVNPEDPEVTWTGRGRKPRWVTESLEQGKSMEDLLI